MPKLSFDYAKVRSDVRFRALVKRVGSEGEAWDRLLRFWDLALAHWGHGHALLPTATFDLDPELAVLLDVRLAERRESGVYARGAEEHFAWYAERLESAKKAGKASAEVRRAKFGTAQPNPNQTFGGRSEIPEPNPNEPFERAEPNPNEPFERAEPNPNASTSSSALASKTEPSNTPPVVPQSSPPPEDPPRITRSEQRAADAESERIGIEAAAHAASVFAAAASVDDDPYGEYAQNAYGQLDPAAMRLLAAVHKTDGWGQLVRSLTRHRKTRSPDTKLAEQLRIDFIAKARAKPALLEHHPHEEESHP